MTVVMSLNFGDRIYLASDSLVTVPDNGKRRPIGFCLKLYEVRNCNSVVGFAGSIQSARDAIAIIDGYASSQVSLGEERLFEKIPELLESSCTNWNPGSRYDLDIMYAGLTPHSRAYENEKYPGLGVPPKTVCGYFSVSGNPRTVKVRKGSAIHVPSNPDIKMTPTNPYMLMDAFVIGSGERKIESPQSFFSLKYQPPEFVVSVLPLELQTFFEDIPIENTGIGGHYQVAIISEEGIRISVIAHSQYPDGVTVNFKHGAFFVTDRETGTREIIKTIWDDRLPFEFDEYQCLL